DAEALLTRPKELMDNAVPSANSTAAVALLRLAALTGDESLREPAEVVLRLLGEAAGRVPLAFGNVLHAAELLLLLGTAIVLVVERPALPHAERGATSPDLSLRHPRILDQH
ncbi:MAG: hypothetical protein ABW213_12445, partial [Tardiphaga sp.]